MKAKRARGNGLHITSKTDPVRQLTIFTIHGEVQCAAVIEALRKFWDENPTRNVLWDLRNGRVTHLHSNELTEIVNYTSINTREIRGGKVAAVVPDKSEYTFLSGMRLLTTVSRFTFEIEVFRTQEEAHTWFEEKSVRTLRNRLLRFFAKAR